MYKNYKIFTAFVYILLWTCLFSNYAAAQGAWNQKADFGGTGRGGAAGFSIGTKGYIGTGHDGTSFRKDFWEWDQATDVWTQKSDFGGSGRRFAVGFSIGVKGYIGMGDTINITYVHPKNDFWEWDQATNIWTQKANFGGSGRVNAVGFSIGTKGYVGTGLDSAIQKNDFWEWDQATDTWIQKSNFPGAIRFYATGFSIGQKGYITLGGHGHWGTYYFDFWEWDQSNDAWTQKANFPGIGNGRIAPVSFVIGNKAYVGTGNYFCGPSCGTVYCKDIWEWNQVNNIWAQRADLSGAGRSFSVSFSIGSKGYIGTGNGGYYKDFWEYCDTCTVGINDLQSAISISVFPNPTAGKIAINSSAIISSVEIYNVQGVKVSTSQKANEIDLSTQQAGVYFMLVKTEAGAIAKKIVVQK